MRGLVTIVPFVLGGCLPALDFDVTDATPPPVGGDAGPPGVPNAPDLGRPCGTPYLAVALDGLESDAGRVERFTLPALEECRQTELGSRHPDFGDEVLGVTQAPGGHEILGVAGGLLGLDADGFPRWRLQVGGSSPPYPGELAIVGSNVAAMYHDSGRLRGVLVARPADGGLVAHLTAVPSDLVTFAPDPSRPGSVLVSRSYGAIYSVPLPTAGDTLARGDDEVLPQRDGVGGVQTLQADPTGDRVVITHQSAVFTWRRGASVPSAPMTCDGATCGDFHAATWDPTGDDVIAICDDPTTGRVRHIVRVNAGGCTLAVDGTLRGQARFFELAPML